MERHVCACLFLALRACRQLQFSSHQCQLYSTSFYRLHFYAQTLSYCLSCWLILELFNPLTLHMYFLFSDSFTPRSICETPLPSLPIVHSLSSVPRGAVLMLLLSVRLAHPSLALTWQVFPSCCCACVFLVFVNHFSGQIGTPQSTPLTIVTQTLCSHPAVAQWDRQWLDPNTAWRESDGAGSRRKSCCGNFVSLKC